MKRNTIALLIGFLLVAGAAEAAQGQTTTTDEAAIRQVVQQVQDGWNSHDGKAFAAPFTMEADYVIVNGMHIKGRAAIEAGHTQIFTTVYRESRNQATIKRIRFLRPDIAVVHVEWNLEFQAGGETRKGHAMNSMVMTKEKDKWSIASFHNTPIAPPSGPPPAK